MLDPIENGRYESANRRNETSRSGSGKTNNGPVWTVRPRFHGDFGRRENAPFRNRPATISRVGNSLGVRSTVWENLHRRGNWQLARRRRRFFSGLAVTILKRATAPVDVTRARAAVGPALIVERTTRTRNNRCIDYVGVRLNVRKHPNASLFRASPTDISKRSENRPTFVKNHFSSSPNDVAAAARRPIEFPANPEHQNRVARFASDE